MPDLPMTPTQYIADTNKELHDIKHELRNLSAKQVQAVEINEKNVRDTTSRIADLSAKVTLLHESNLSNGHSEKIKGLEEFVKMFLSITNMRDYASMIEENEKNTKFRTQWFFLWVGITGTLSFLGALISIFKMFVK